MRVENGINEIEGRNLREWINEYASEHIIAGLDEAERFFTKIADEGVVAGLDEAGKVFTEIIADEGEWPLYDKGKNR